MYWDLEIVGDLDEADTRDIKSLEQRLVDACIGPEPLYGGTLAQAKNFRLTILLLPGRYFGRQAGLSSFP